MLTRRDKTFQTLGWNETIQWRHHHEYVPLRDILMMMPLSLTFC